MSLDKLDYHVYDSPAHSELFADLHGGSESGSVKRTKVAQAFPPWAPSCSSCLTTATTGAFKSR